MSSSAVPTGWRLWVAGARPRTLGAAVAPVAVGTGVAVADGDVVVWRALVALVVSLALQVGVNYANDYSDGVRGTDVDRQGPVRLTASGLARPSAVKRAAALAFLTAAVAGLALAIAVSWWLVAVGAACIAAAALYTGGPRPYGYEGFGEISVLVFFGLVATVGSAYVHLERVDGVAVVGGAVVGLLACAILLANNIRDVGTDAVTGKRTLAVRVGARPARRLYVGCVARRLRRRRGARRRAPAGAPRAGGRPLAGRPVRTILDETAPPPAAGGRPHRDGPARARHRPAAGPRSRPVVGRPSAVWAPVDRAGEGGGDDGGHLGRAFEVGGVAGAVDEVDPRRRTGRPGQVGGGGGELGVEGAGDEVGHGPVAGQLLADGGQPVPQRCHGARAEQAQRRRQAGGRVGPPLGHAGGGTREAWRTAAGPTSARGRRPRRRARSSGPGPRRTPPGPPARPPTPGPPWRPR